MNSDLFEGGYAKKPYLPIGKQFVCGKERVIYKKNTNTDSSKVYMRHNAKYVQVVNFEKEMIAKGKWKLPTPVKQSNNKPNVKPCKEDQYRNPATGRCVYNRWSSKGRNGRRTDGVRGAFSLGWGGPEDSVFALSGIRSIVKGKWKLPTPVKQSNNKPNVKPCKEDQYRNPATGRCVYNRWSSKGRNGGRTDGVRGAFSIG